MDDPKFRSQIEVLSVVDKGRRRDWADAEKVRIVEESLRGYRQCAATARRHEISRAFLTRWRRDFRSGQLVSEGRPQFMAVQVSADTDGSGVRQPQGSGNLRGPATSGVRQLTGSPAAGGCDRVEITLGNGRKIALAVFVDPLALARLIQVVDRA